MPPRCGRGCSRRSSADCRPRRSGCARATRSCSNGSDGSGSRSTRPQARLRRREASSLPLELTRGGGCYTADCATRRRRLKRIPFRNGGPGGRAKRLKIKLFYFKFQLFAMRALRRGTANEDTTLSTLLYDHPLGFLTAWLVAGIGWFHPLLGKCVDSTDSLTDRWDERDLPLAQPRRESNPSPQTCPPISKPSKSRGKINTRRAARSVQATYPWNIMAACQSSEFRVHQRAAPPLPPAMVGGGGGGGGAHSTSNSSSR